MKESRYEVGMEKLREVEEAFQEQTGCACRFLC